MICDGRLMVLGELRGRHAAGAQPVQQGRQHMLVVRHPLQAGVGEHHVEVRAQGIKRTGIQDLEIAVGVADSIGSAELSMPRIVACG